MSMYECIMSWFLKCFGFYTDSKPRRLQLKSLESSSTNSVCDCKVDECCLASSSFSLGDSIPVKETNIVTRSKDSNGSKMVNEYAQEQKIGAGNYGKVVLYRNVKDGKLYALKIFHKHRLKKVRVAPGETAFTDVLREVAIMKKLDHPNVVKLIEVLDDPTSDCFYLVLEYVEGRRIFQGCGPALVEDTARKYFRDILAGLAYLHSSRVTVFHAQKNIIHGDIKPENLLVTEEGQIKICDFSVSKEFKGNNDELHRSPGTPIFTAPECCQGFTYHGKKADVWALGVTLYCMVSGCYPFVGETLQATYDKIVHDPLHLPSNMNPELADLLRRLLCKDPKKRISLHDAARHPWVLKVLSSTTTNEENYDQLCTDSSGICNKSD